MITNIHDARLAPLTDLDEAEEAVRPVARSMVRLIGATVRLQCAPTPRIWCCTARRTTRRCTSWQSATRRALT